MLFYVICYVILCNIMFYIICYVILCTIVFFIKYVMLYYVLVHEPRLISCTPQDSMSLVLLCSEPFLGSEKPMLTYFNRDQPEL